MQLKKATPIPATLTNLKELTAIVQKRVNLYNCRHKAKATQKPSPDELSQALTPHQLHATETLVQWPQQKDFSVIDNISQVILRLKEDAVVDPADRHPLQVLLDTETETKKANQGIADMKQDVAELKEVLLKELFQLKDKLNEKTVLPRARKTEKPLRDPAGSPIYKYLMNLKKPANVSAQVWARNRVAITLLRFLGIRASELMQIRLRDLQLAMQKGTLQLLQRKTGTRRILVLTDSAIAQLKEIERDISKAFTDTETPLGAPTDRRAANRQRSLMLLSNWRKVLNRFIKRVNDVYPGVYTSHSFRINFVTRLLKTVPLTEVKSIIGHKSVTTTERYYRFQPKGQELKKTIDQAINSDEK